LTIVDGEAFRAFGLCVVTDFPLPALADARPAPGPVTLAARLERYEPPWRRPGDQLVWETVFDGVPYEHYRGASGEHRFVYGDRAAFRLSPDHTSVTCALVDYDDPGWQRLFLDTILWSCSAIRGFELLHASAVTSARGALAIVTVTGGGKSSLAAELVARGRRLLCDDVLAIDRQGGRVMAHPGPPVMNLPPAGPAEIGRTLARFDDEAWVAVERSESEALPLEAICLLERRPGAPLALERWEATSVDLLPYLFAFPDGPERAARRFEAVGEVAAEVPIHRLSADLDVPPAELAALVERELDPDPATLVEL
jgi:hypothetical protein